MNSYAQEIQMSTLLIVLIAVLGVHYFLAVATITILLKDKGVVKGILPWNLTILLIPILGPVTYLIYRSINKKH